MIKAPYFKRRTTFSFSSLGRDKWAKSSPEAFPTRPTLVQPRFLCELIEALAVTRPMLTIMALRHRLHIFADGRVNGPLL